MDHEHLPIAVSAGAEADRRDRQTLSDLLGQFERHSLQNDGKRAGFFDRERIAQHPLTSLLFPALNLIATELMHRLRCQPDVAHYRNAGFYNRIDGVAHRDPTLELDGLGTCLFEKSSGILQRLFPARLIRKKRHVADQQRAFAPARDQARVINHLVHGHSQSIGLALNHTAQRVADQQHFDPRLVEDPRKRVIVCRETGNLFAALLHFKNMRYGDLVAHVDPPKTKKPSGPNPKANAGRKSRFSLPEKSPFGIRLSPDYLDPSGI